MAVNSVDEHESELPDLPRQNLIVGWDEGADAFSFQVPPLQSKAQDSNARLLVALRLHRLPLHWIGRWLRCCLAGIRTERTFYWSPLLCSRRRARRSAFWNHFLHLWNLHLYANKGGQVTT
jgi:hypothetical protein